MAFCNKCGNQLPDGANNCPNCGAPAGNAQQNTQNFVNNMMNTADTTSQFDVSDTRSLDEVVNWLIAWIYSKFLHSLLQSRKNR